jgi:translation initiation factor 4E
LYWQNLVLAAIGETMEDMEPPPTADGPPPPTLTSMVNGVRVVDKSRTFPMFKLEIWLSTRDPTLREQIKEKLQEIMTNGQSPSSRKAHPKWEWKDHT